MGVMYLGFSDASGISVAKDAAASFAGMSDQKTDCIPGNIPCTVSFDTVRDFVRASHNSATSPRADDPVIIGRRSGHASCSILAGSLYKALSDAWEVAV